jgi:hypothetical protein
MSVIHELASETSARHGAFVRTQDEDEWYLVGGGHANVILPLDEKLVICQAPRELALDGQKQPCTEREQRHMSPTRQTALSGGNARTMVSGWEGHQGSV